MGSLDSAQEQEALLQSIHPLPHHPLTEGQEMGCQGDCQALKPDHAANLAPLDSGLTLAPADYQTLLDELAQLQKLDQERCTRIHHLEKALDQALACLEELRSQVHDQQFLENQLANTEEYASVQQQAIARLKLQLAEQQAALDAQILETQQRDQAIQELLATIESMTQAQQREVERLRSRLAQDQLEVQTHRSLLGKQLHDLQAVLESRQQRVCELEGETLAARSLSSRLQSQLELAQQQIKDLSARLAQQRTQLVQLENQLEHSRSTAHAAHSVSGKQSADLDPRAHFSTHSSGHPSWLKTPQQADELEKRLGLQLAQQARWQQQHHDLETDRERLQNRVAEMEHQIAEMQEQILRQAQQATEYETAVQYWKDRYSNGQHQMHHLKELAEQLLLQSAAQELDPLLLDLLATLQLAPSAAQTELQAKTQSSQPIPPLPLPRLTSVELPEFLVRRRAAQKNMNAAPL